MERVLYDAVSELGKLGLLLNFLVIQKKKRTYSIVVVNYYVLVGHHC